MRKHKGIDRSLIRRVVIYARVSTDKQAEKETPIDGQILKMTEYAQQEGWDIVDQFVDGGRSGRTDKRPEFQRMISQAKQIPRPFDAILVWKFNRFARNTDDAKIYKMILRKRCGVEIISINEPIDEGSIGNLVENILAAIDEFFSDNLAGDCFRGMELTARQGHFNGGNIPIGYRNIKKESGNTLKSVLDIDEIYAPIIERIFKLYLSGSGTKDIAKLLNEEGLTTPRNQKWTVQKIAYILKNEVYVGTYVWNRTTRDHLNNVVENAAEDVIRIADAVPAIVDRDTFDRTQARLHALNPLRQDAIPARTVNSDYLLSGLLRCRCGGAMTGADAKSGRYRYYACTRQMKAGKTTCDMKFIPQDVLENTVIDYLKSNLLTEQNIAVLISHLQAEQGNEQSEWRDRLRAVEKELTEARSKLRRLFDAVEEGTITKADLAPRIRERNAQVLELEVSQRELQAVLAQPPTYQMALAEIRGFVADCQKTLTEGSPAEQKEFLRSFISRISLDRVGEEWEVRLKFTFPAPLKGSAGNPVLATVVGGRAFDTDSKLICEIWLNGVS